MANIELLNYTGIPAFWADSYTGTAEVTTQTNIVVRVNYPALDGPTNAAGLTHIVNYTLSDTTPTIITQEATAPLGTLDPATFVYSPDGSWFEVTIPFAPGDGWEFDFNNLQPGNSSNLDVSFLVNTPIVEACPLRFLTACDLDPATFEVNGDGKISAIGWAAPQAPTLTAGTSTSANETADTSDLSTTDTFADNGSPITDTGWTAYLSGTDENDASAVSQSDGGVSPYTFTGLTAWTMYCAKPYATNAGGTTYGTEVCFNTIAIPSVQLDSVTNVGVACADSQSTVTVPASFAGTIVEQGVIAYSTPTASPDFGTADDTYINAGTLFTDWQVVVESWADLSEVSYDSVTETWTRTAQIWSYIKDNSWTYYYSPTSQSISFIANTLSTGLESYYAMDWSALDSTGNGHNGTVNWPAFIAGEHWQKAFFDWVNDYIDLDTTALDISGDYSISVRYTHRAWTNIILSKWPWWWLNASRWSVVVTNTPYMIAFIAWWVVRLRESNTTWTVAIDAAWSTTLVDGQQYSLTFEKSGQELLVSLNWEVEATVISPYPAIVAPEVFVFWNFWYLNTATFMWADIEEIGLRNRVLTECERKLIHKKWSYIPY